MKEESSIYKISAIGIFAALVFVSNFISIPIPVAIGDVSRIHLANGVCLLAGLVLGPLGGGLAAGIGSALFDITNPLYIASAGFTLVFKFLLAAIPGFFIKYQKPVINILGCVLGQIVYIVLYLSKSYLFGILEGSAPKAMIPAMITKLGTSSINAVIAIIIAILLFTPVRAALNKSKLSFTKY